MSYSAINSHRMAYDIDGSAVGYTRNAGEIKWFTSQEKGDFNDEAQNDFRINGQEFYADNMKIWFFFPELREITHIMLATDGGYHNWESIVLEGSNDSTNGYDGNWETAICGSPIINAYKSRPDFWREFIRTVSLSSSYKVLRISFGSGWETRTSAIHLYGHKAAGETPDDICFCNISDEVLMTLRDRGDTPEGTTTIEAFKVKNISPTKIANGVNLQLNHADYGLSFSVDGPWSAVLDISTIAPDSLSAPVYVKYSLGPPLLTLGPRAARIITTVASWI